jgi:gamma-glutamylcyclotransferase (GGCT)/AIG2-like uncharacterized protein YtfP
VDGGNPLQERLISRLIDIVSGDRFPSITMMDRIEGTLRTSEQATLQQLQQQEQIQQQRRQQLQQQQEQGSQRQLEAA